MAINIFDLLNKVYGARGLPFPAKPKQGDGAAIGQSFDGPLEGDAPKIATGFKYDASPLKDITTSTAITIRKWEDESLGRYTFMPVTLSGKGLPANGYDLPNPLIIITGEKLVVETDVMDVGTVFEKVCIRPYDITVICTIIGLNREWPEHELNDFARMWKEGDLFTLRSAITAPFLQKENNFIMTKISILDNAGAENVEVIQIDGRSNIDFELVIK